MTRFIYILSAMLLSSAASAAMIPEKPSEPGKNYEYALVVPDIDGAVSFLVSDARRHRGVVTFYSGQKVEFRVPASESAALISSIRSAGYIRDENTQASDTGEQIAVLKSQIAVKREYLTKLYKLTEESDLGGTLTAEREIENAINEIDRLKSRIRGLERQNRFSSFSLTISGPTFEGGEKPYSIWGFINSLGLDHLVQGK